MLPAAAAVPLILQLSVVAMLQAGLAAQVLRVAVVVVLLGAHAVLSDAVPCLKACLPHATSDSEASQSDMLS